MTKGGCGVLAAAATIATFTAVALAGTGGATAVTGHQPIGAGRFHPQVAAGAVPSIHKLHVIKRRNRSPLPDYFGPCAQQGFNSVTCVDQAVAAIEGARKHDHTVKKQAVILPYNFRRLSVARQTFIIMNLERVDRGIRPLKGLVPRLSGLSKSAARSQLDPILNNVLGTALGVGEWRSVWSSDLGPLASDFDWMYNDSYGPAGSINIACPTPVAPGCWGHRRNILSPFTGMRTLVAGAGTAKPRGASISELSVGLRGGKPRHYSYTWKKALNHGANGHKIAHHLLVLHHGHIPSAV